MYKSLFGFLRLVFYIIIVIFGVIIAVNNREKVKITLFPIPYEAFMPMFVFAIVVFVAGIITGWLLAKVKFIKFSETNRRQENRVKALENELLAIRSEKRIKNDVISA